MRILAISNPCLKVYNVWVETRQLARLRRLGRHIYVGLRLERHVHERD